MPDFKYIQSMTIKAVKMPVNSFQEETRARPDRKDAEEAVRALLRYIGEDPSRAGLLDTPARVVRAYDEFFSGYDADPRLELCRTFEDIEDYDDMVVVRHIDFVSHCEHHLVPIIGRASVGYWPDKKVVGISKLARVVDIFAKRLISQENMTGDIAGAISDVLTPKGVAVVVEADHQCMSTRGINKLNASTVTSKFTGVFLEDAEVRKRFLETVRS